MNLSETLKEKREEILSIAGKHGVTGIRVFGSAARGDDTPESDIDFLIEVGGPTTPWFPGGLIVDLEKLLGRQVQVVTEDSIYWLLRRRILKEAVPL